MGFDIFNFVLRLPWHTSQESYSHFSYSHAHVHLVAVAPPSGPLETKLAESLPFWSFSAHMCAANAPSSLTP